MPLRLCCLVSQLDGPPPKSQNGPMPIANTQVMPQDGQTSSGPQGQY